MSHSEGPRRIGAAPYLLLILFAAATLLFVQLLRPLAAPDDAAPPVSPPSASSSPASSPGPILAAAPPASPADAPSSAVVPEASPAPVPVAPPPYRPDFEGPRIAVILTDVGDNPAQARAAIAALPANIGLAFTPYPNVQPLVRAARADGHEIWVGVPMQPKAWPRVSPGKNTLLVGADPAENLRRLDWSLARVGGVVGITGMMGSAFTESETALRPVLDDARRRGLAYVDARASGRSAGFATARAIGARAAVNDRFLDESGTIAGNLDALERQARSDGDAIGFARPLPATVAALQAWAATLEGKGILLVPPSSLAR